ncbi:hypothetical protein [Bdellovibrio bacteriovorus]|uniref:hypothetical protein n=1 Tax=Bdellovibrio bacteriovorus TaxID=959 RepID=UPI003D00B4DC
MLMSCKDTARDSHEQVLLGIGVAKVQEVGGADPVEVPSVGTSGVRSDGVKLDFAEPDAAWGASWLGWRMKGLMSLWRLGAAIVVTSPRDLAFAVITAGGDADGLNKGVEFTDTAEIPS